MKKILTAALACALGLATAGQALATDSRINGLSAAGPAFNEKSITIRDSANIYPLPQFMVTYKNSVDVDATKATKYGTMNIRYALSDDSVLLLFGKASPWKPVLKVKTIGQQDAATTSGFNAHAGLEDTHHQFGVGFGLKAGESMRLGTTLSIGGKRADNDPITNNSNWLADFTVGLGFDLNETNSLDFGLNLQFGGFSNIETRSAFQDSYLAEGIFGISLLAKGEFQVHQIAKIVPYVRFGLDRRGVNHANRSDDLCPSPGPSEGETCDDPKAAHLTNIALSLGTDLAISPVDGVLIQPGLGLALRTSNLIANQTQASLGLNPPELNAEVSRQWLPFYGFSAEAKAFDWLVLRLGARQTIVRTDSDNTLPTVPPGTPQPSNASANSQVVNTVSTGVGIKMMGWDLDVNMNPDFFNQGLHAVTGNPTGGWGIDFALGYDW